MCGRFSLTSPPQRLDDHFRVAHVPEMRRRYNIAPAQEVAVLRFRPQEGRGWAVMRWGLVPSWSRQVGKGSGLINARAETVSEKPSFRESFASRRCLIPADGFYEWRRRGGGKQPWRIARADDGPFAFAGLWDRLSDPAGAAVESCAIITTVANALMRPIHERMPVILDPDDYALWLGEEGEGGARVLSLLGPRDDPAMIAYPVSARVNNPANDDDACIARLGEARGRDGGPAAS